MLFFLLFLAELFVLFLLSHSLTRSISFVLYHLTKSKKVTIYVLSILFFPGTVLHELAHAGMAALLRVHVGKMEFVPTIEGDRVKMGSVQVGQTDFFRRFLIGAAPFLVGVSILLASLFYAAQQNLLENPWMVLLIGYGVFEIGNTMFSSRKDMEGALELLITIVVLILMFYFLGIQLPSFNPDIIFENQHFKYALQQGTLFLLVPILIDVAIIAILKFLRQ